MYKVTSEKLVPINRNNIRAIALSSSKASSIKVGNEFKLDIILPGGGGLDLESVARVADEQDLNVFYRLKDAAAWLRGNILDV